VIKPVIKLTSAGNWLTDIVETEDYLWLFSEVEIGGVFTRSFEGEGRQYAYYEANNTNEGRLKQTPPGTNFVWMGRSPYNNNASQYCCVIATGALSYDSSSGARGVSFGFCV
jgi:hypothetical protein